MNRIVLLFAMLISSSANAIDKYTSDGSLTIEYDQKLKAEYVVEQCENSSMVGESSGIRLLVNTKREKLISLKGSLEFERYSVLSQKLEGYSVEWEILHKELERSCKKDAACRYRYDESPRWCSSTEASYSDARKELLMFIRELRKLEVK